MAAKSAEVDGGCHVIARQPSAGVGTFHDRRPRVQPEQPAGTALPIRIPHH